MRIRRGISVSLLLAAMSWLVSGCVVTDGDERAEGETPATAPVSGEGGGEAAAEVVVVTPENTTRYVDADAGFSIALPNDWEQVQDYQGTEVIAVGPPATPGGPTPTVNVVLERLAEPISLEEYFNRSQQNLGTKIGDLTIDEKGDSTLAGQPAKWMAMRSQVDGQAVQAMSWFVVAGQRAYVITAGVDPTQFVTYRERFEELAGSLELTEPSDGPTG